MPVLVAVLGAALAALLVMLASIGLSRLVVDPVPQPIPDAPPQAQAAEDPKAVPERWLVDHLARVRGIRHVVTLFDRFLFGGALVGIALVAVLTGATLVGWLLSTVDSSRGFARFDQSAAQWGSDHATDASTTALRWITHLGGSVVLITVMAIIGLVVAFRQRRHDQPRWVVLGFLLTVGVGIVIVNNGLKWTVDRDRPTVTHLVHASGTSFPSGHSAAAAACWAAMALIAARRLPERHRRWLAAIAVSIAVAVASSRVLLGVHWLTDVIAGVVVGWTWFFLVALVYGGRLQRFGAPVEDVAGAGDGYTGSRARRPVQIARRSPPIHPPRRATLKPAMKDTSMSKTPHDDHRLRVGVIVHTEKQLGAGLEELRAVLAALGHADPPWCEIDKSKQAPKQVRKLIDDGVDRLLVWGGDGTVRRCIDTVVGDSLDDKVAIGILPAGTANLLANNLDLPLNLRAAVENALHGEPRRIDVGLVNGEEHFAVMAGGGFDALMIKDADESGAKDRWGRLGYVIAGARNINISPAEAMVTVDGTEWYKGPAASVIAGNVGSLFGGLCAFPHASPFDGRLDVGVAAARTRTEWMRLFGAAVTHRVEASPFVEETSGEKIVIEFDRTLPWQADGGDLDRVDRLEVQCLPSAVAICQPRQTTEKDPS